jgi:transcription antitermination factor NusG
MFAPGDNVQVASGTLQGLEGKYIAHDGETRAFVLIDLLGQPQKLRMAIDGLRIA